MERECRRGDVLPRTRRRTFLRRPMGRGFVLAFLIVVSAQTDDGRAQTQAPTQPAEYRLQSMTRLAPSAEPAPTFDVASTNFAEAVAAAPSTPPAGLPDVATRAAAPPPAPIELPADLLVAQSSPKAEPGGASPSAGVKSAAPTTKLGEGWVDVSGEKWTVKMGGHVQLDYINWLQANPAIVGAQDFFEFRRLRLTADGTGYGTYDFRLQMTLEPETVGETPGVISPDVKDAYFSVNELPLLGRWRIGNFFVPFGLEQVTNDTNNIFLERSIPTQGVFTADREVGMALYDCTESKNFTWSTGVFFDSISEGLKERIDDNQGYRVSGRVTWLPYYDEPSNGRYLIFTGLGILHTNDQDNRVRFRARPQIREGPRLIDSGVLNGDNYTIGNWETAVVWGRFALQSESYLATVSLNNSTHSNARGAYAHVSYFLTGENRVFERFGQHGAQFARNVPISNVFRVPGFVSLGAWELKARWSYLNLSDLNAGTYNDMTFGVNWYWSDRVRCMFDWIHPFPSAQTVFGAAQADILAMRFDFNW